MKDSKTLTYTLLVLSTFFWGISFVMTKELLDAPHMTVTILITLRLTVATLVMVPALALARKLERVRREDIKWFLLLALAEPFVYNLCETNGVAGVSSSLASVVVATIPLFVPFGMWVAYRKRVKASMLVGVALSLGGVALLLTGGEGLRGSLQGLLFLCGAVFIAVVYTLILVKIVDHYRPVTITTYQNLIGHVYYIPLMMAVDGDSLVQLAVTPKIVGLLLALGICCSTLAYVFYNRGVRELGASEACIFNNAIPVVTYVVAVTMPGLGHGETFSWLRVAGIVITIVGVVVAQSGTDSMSKAR